MCGSAPVYDILTSCTRSSYIPWYKMEITRTGENRGKPCRVARKDLPAPVKIAENYCVSLASRCINFKLMIAVARKGPLEGLNAPVFKLGKIRK